ncbi:MarR family winged helix-turn-helix transcriptional regulator [Aliarcobacter lanthieri]|uniref:MarR family winged helix-turn-helix transcriptional regulator n=1 Tax=Aliarcobacter lanthieri TaxID=1355374 RepID=UPI003AABFBDF
MDKKYFDDFYNLVKTDERYEIFAITFPLLVINKELFNKAEKDTKQKYDLLNVDVDVLASLYFRAKDYTMTPTDLYDHLVFSSGGMTKVLKKLEDRGLIKRVSSIEDKRKSLVCLTTKGIDLVKEIMDSKMCKGEDFFSILDKKERENLKNIFAKVLYSLN